MRHLTVRVPRGHAAEVLEAARAQGGVNLAAMQATGEDGAALDVVLAQVPNPAVAPLLAMLERVPSLHATLLPQGVIPLRPPADKAAEQAMDVGARSPLEVYLGGLQSVGSWLGFLGYAAAAGVIVWIGLYTGAIFLLVAAMLVAPFAGPAMNAALATARGDAALFGRSLGRYFAALLVTIVVAALVSWAMGLQSATRLMEQTSLVSSLAVLLPLVAGAAGALNLCQSERSSLVSGAATGMLVAASLAPPAGLVGIGLVIGEWGMVRASAFVLVLQLAGINLAGAVVFRLQGLSASGVRYPRGRRGVAAAAWGGTLAVLAGLLAMQFADAPALQHSTIAQRAAVQVRAAVRESGLGRAVDTDVRFKRSGAGRQDRMLVLLYAERTDGGMAREAVASRLAGAVRARLAARFDAEPLVDVTVLGD